MQRLRLLLFHALSRRWSQRLHRLLLPQRTAAVDPPTQVSQVLAMAPRSAAGLVDTCQKTCVGRRAYLAHCDILRPPEQSSMLVAIPAGMEGEATGQHLASLKLLSQLGAVLDLPKQSGRPHTIGVTVQLAQTLGVSPSFPSGECRVPRTCGTTADSPRCRSTPRPDGRGHT